MAFRRAYLLFIPATFVLGCAKDPYRAAIEEQAQAQEELVQILHSVKDPGDMDGAWNALSKNYGRQEETNRRRTRLHPPSSEAKDRLAREYGPRFQAALQKSLQELRRIRELPEGDVFFKKFTELSRNTGLFDKTP